MKVVSDGRTVYEWNPAEAANQFKTYGGEWSVVDGALRQSSLNENVRAMAPGRVFTNYTYSLKARKLSGNEGFLVLFNVADPEAKSWWNVGGWANDHHALEIGSVVGNEKKGSVETNRWYDLRIEVAGKSVKCYLDGELTCEGSVPESTSLHANATRTAAGEVIIKVVNVAAEAIETDLQWEGISKVARPVETTVLTSASGEDENSLAQPEKIVPRHQTLMAGANGLRHSFPGNSLTILRFKKD